MASNQSEENARHPIGKWRTRIQTITYQTLCGLHPTRNGIYVKSDCLVSIQILVPNKYDYNDFFFCNSSLTYAPSKGDSPGNKALDRAYREGKCFKAYLGYKKGKNDEKDKNRFPTYELKLIHLGVKPEFFGKSFKLGIVKIKQKTPDGKYIIVPFDESKGEQTTSENDSDSSDDSSEGEDEYENVDQSQDYQSRPHKWHVKTHNARTRPY